MTTKQAAEKTGLDESSIRKALSALGYKKQGRDWWITEEMLTAIQNRKDGRRKQ